MLTFLCASISDYMPLLWVLLILGIPIVFGFIVEAIYKSKGYKGGFFLGAFLTLAGVIIAANLPSKKDILKDVYDEIEKNSK